VPAAGTTIAKRADAAAGTVAKRADAATHMAKGAAHVSDEAAF